VGRSSNAFDLAAFIQLKYLFRSLKSSLLQLHGILFGGNKESATVLCFDLHFAVLLNKWSMSNIPKFSTTGTQTV
jgi:hypothetical protein